MPQTGLALCTDHQLFYPINVLLKMQILRSIISILMSGLALRIRDKPKPDVQIQKLLLKYRVVACSDTLRHALWSKEANSQSLGGNPFLRSWIILILGGVLPFGVACLSRLWRQSGQYTVQTPTVQALTFR